MRKIKNWAVKTIAETISALWDFTVGIKTDDISESNAGSGITVDTDTLIKDGVITSKEVDANEIKQNTLSVVTRCMHRGVREIFAGNNGLGQSAPTFNSHSNFSLNLRTYAHGEGSYAFCGGVFDGTSIWLVPLNSSNLIKVNPSTGVMTSYVHGQGSEAFSGGVFDGTSIWLVPYNSSNLVKVNPSTGDMTSYAHGQSNNAFIGGVFDGTSIWLVPRSSSNLVKVNPSTGAMTSYAHGQSNNAFAGGVFDGTSIWLVPYNSSNLVKVNPSTGAMTSYVHGQGSEAFSGGVFDGTSIWLVPLYSSNLIKVNPSTGAMTSYVHGQGGYAFIGGVFDGTSIWLVPLYSSNLVKVNPSTGAMTSYVHGQGSYAFNGGVFDGTSIWLVPYNSLNLCAFYPPELGFGYTKRNLAVTETFRAGTSIEADVINEARAGTGVTIDSLTLVKDGAITSGADTDTVSTLGMAKIGFDGTTADRAVMAHYDNMNNTDYAFAQAADGQHTDINTKTGGSIYFKENNVAIAGLTSAGLTGASGKVLSFPTIQSNYATDSDSDTDDVLSTGITGVAGMLVLNCDGKSGLYRIDESNNLSAIDADSDFSVTKDTASHYNLYYETDQFKLQNKVGNDKAIAVGIYIA